MARKLIDDELVDAIIRRFTQDSLPDKRARLRQPRFSREVGPDLYPHAPVLENEISNYGFMLQGLKDPHVDLFAPGFAGLLLQVLCSVEVQQVLQSFFPGNKSFTLHQSMFFDFNPGTEIHVDNYYIDTEPRGELVGFWLALEDIDPTAGPFFIMPGSDTAFDWGSVLEMANTPLLNRCEKYFQENRETMFVCEFKKGDAVFWRSNIMHGSLQNTNPRKSRKSLTGHYSMAQSTVRNRNRLLQTSVRRSTMGMHYAVTNRPNANDYEVAKISKRIVDVDGKERQFNIVSLKTGDQFVFVDQLEPGTPL